MSFTVQVVTGEPGRPAAIRPLQFDTKRQALAFIRQTPHTFIRRNGNVYTIYPKKGK